MKRKLYHNEDCTEFFYRNRVQDGRADELLNRWVDTMAKAGVTDYIINTNARRTNYRSDAWESFWDGYDPDGPDNQPFLKSLSADALTRHHDGVASMLAVHQQGIDYPAYVIERCRRQGMTPWISLRMNDCHCTDNMEHPFHGSFWKDNPQFYTQGLPQYFKRCLDYTFQEVRDYFMALIDETLDRYDIDGLELDFMREPYLFDKGKADVGTSILNEWLSSVRKRVDKTIKRRGHPVRIGARVPSCPETATALGIDVKSWIDEHLVDLLVFTPRFSTLEFDMPVRQWRELVSPESGITLAGGLEAHYMPRPDWKYDKPEKVSPELARGAAALVLADGADAVYLFNYFQSAVGHPDWEMQEYQQTLKAMSSLSSLLEMPRTVGITYRDITVPGENYRAPLSATGTELEFTMKTGPVSDKARPCRLRIGLAASDKMPVVMINNQTCANGTEDKTLSNERIKFVIFDISCEILNEKERNTIKISSQNNEQITVMQVEIDL